MRGQSVTIEDVADAAGVSRQTVSRVINGHPNVKATVRERVQTAIVDLGYVPNLSARRMGGARSYLILAVNDRQRTIDNWQAGRGNDWVDQMLCGGMTECEKHQYNFLFQLIDTAPDDAVTEVARRIGSIRPDGVILTPPHCDNEALVQLLKDRGIACARVGHRAGDASVDQPASTYWSNAALNPVGVVTDPSGWRLQPSLSPTWLSGWRTSAQNLPHSSITVSIRSGVALSKPGRLP